MRKVLHLFIVLLSMAGGPPALAQVAAPLSALIDKSVADRYPELTKQVQASEASGDAYPAAQWATKLGTALVSDQDFARADVLLSAVINLTDRWDADRGWIGMVARANRLMALSSLDDGARFLSEAQDLRVRLEAWRGRNSLVEFTIVKNFAYLENRFQRPGWTLAWLRSLQNNPEYESDPAVHMSIAVAARSSYSPDTLSLTDSAARIVDKSKLSGIHKERLLASFVVTYVSTKIAYVDPSIDMDLVHAYRRVSNLNVDSADPLYLPIQEVSSAVSAICKDRVAILRELPVNALDSKLQPYRKFENLWKSHFPPTSVDEILDRYYDEESRELNEKNLEILSLDQIELILLRVRRENIYQESINRMEAYRRYPVAAHMLRYGKKEYAEDILKKITLLDKKDSVYTLPGLLSLRHLDALGKGHDREALARYEARASALCSVLR